MERPKHPDAGDPLELDAEAMRRLGHRAVDLLIERITALDDAPAWRAASRPELDARLREPAPAAPRGPDAALDRLRRDVLPFTASVDHPRFFGYVPGSPTWPGVVADFLAAGSNIFQGTWLASSGPSAVELVVVDWFKEWIGYPDAAGGLMVSGGSVANLTALACAREARLRDGFDDAVLYLSTEVHSAARRAARILGFRHDQIRTLPVDADFRLSLDALAAAVAEDRRRGLRPFLVIGNGGATSTGAVDPLAELAGFCADHDLWFHVDAAYGGFAVLTERGRAMLRGLERADSIALDPHKWLYQPFEVGCVLVRDRRLLHDAFHTRPHYLQDTAVEETAARKDAAAGGQPAAQWQDGGLNFAEHGIQLTRAARALKIWFSIQCFGLDAFREAIDRCLDLAVHAQRRIEATPTLELLTPATLGVVCFRRTEPGDDEAAAERRNTELVNRLLESGVGLISSTRVGERYALRLCILNHRSRAEDVDRVLEWLATA
ncbi:MAG TPA: aminotransferase class V-fold PLP-dependent enzyme [Longimicrobiales bacterium]